MADDAAHLTIAKATHADPVPSNDSDFVLQCVDIGLAGYREAVRSRSRSGRGYSIARTDNRIHRWRYEDGALDRADVGADADQNCEAAIQPETHDDTHAILRPGVAGRDALLTAHGDANRDAALDVDTNPGPRAVRYPASRWSVRSDLLLDSKPNGDKEG